MRSAKESGCFPYGSKLVCFMELWPNGDLIQLSSKHEKREACFHAMGGQSKVVAVWPGNWRSDLFIVDDLEPGIAYQQAIQMIDEVLASKDKIEYTLDWSALSDEEMDIVQEKMTRYLKLRQMYA